MFKRKALEFLNIIKESKSEKLISFAEERLNLSEDILRLDLNTMISLLKPEKFDFKVPEVEEIKVDVNE